MIEEWKAINGLEGLYSVSNHGRVRNDRSGRVLTPKTLPNGYQRVKVRSADGKRDRYVHRLVADAFCVHPEGCDVVNHIDNNTANNRADNLEWTTQQKNVLYAMKQGRMPNFPNAHIVAGIKDGNVHIFYSAKDASKLVGTDSKTIWRWCMNAVTARGFAWRVVA